MDLPPSQATEPNAFGNALGSSLASQSNSSNMPGPVSDEERAAILDMFAKDAPIAPAERASILAMFEGGPGVANGSSYAGGQAFATDVQRRRELIAMGFDPNDGGRVADGARVVIDPRRALESVKNRLSTRIAGDSPASVRATVEDSIRDLADPRFADSLRSQYVLSSEQQASVAAVQKRYNVIQWSSGD